MSKFNFYEKDGVTYLYRGQVAQICPFRTPFTLLNAATPLKQASMETVWPFCNSQCPKFQIGTNSSGKQCVRLKCGSETSVHDIEIESSDDPAPQQSFTVVPNETEKSR